MFALALRSSSGPGPQYTDAPSARGEKAFRANGVRRGVSLSVSPDPQPIRGHSENGRALLGGVVGGAARLADAFAGEAAARERALERGDALRTELGSGVAAELDQRLGARAWLAVRPVGADRVVRVGHEDDACAERDLVSREAGWVPRAV